MSRNTIPRTAENRVVGCVDAILTMAHVISAEPGTERTVLAINRLRRDPTVRALMGMSSTLSTFVYELQRYQGASVYVTTQDDNKVTISEHGVRGSINSSTFMAEPAEVALFRSRYQPQRPNDWYKVLVSRMELLDLLSTPPSTAPLVPALEYWKLRDQLRNHTCLEVQLSLSNNVLIITDMLDDNPWLDTATTNDLSPQLSNWIGKQFFSGATNGQMVGNRNAIYEALSEFENLDNWKHE